MESNLETELAERRRGAGDRAQLGTPGLADWQTPSVARSLSAPLLPLKVFPTQRRTPGDSLQRAARWRFPLGYVSAVDELGGEVEKRRGEEMAKTGQLHQRCSWQFVGEVLGLQNTTCSMGGNFCPTTDPSLGAWSSQSCLRSWLEPWLPMLYLQQQA